MNLMEGNKRAWEMIRLRSLSSRVAKCKSRAVIEFRVNVFTNVKAIAVYDTKLKDKRESEYRRGFAGKS